MPIKLGNAPCSWGVEFADDPRNPPWRRVLDECKAAGYDGIELGPIGFLPEDPALLAGALAERGLELVGGVVFRPFHDPSKWDDVLDAVIRTCKTLKAQGARHLVLIDSISPRRAATAGRPAEAEQMDAAEWKAFLGRIEETARIGVEEYGLVAAIHPHAAGFCDFEPEVEALLAEIDPGRLKICLDTGHSLYAGFDPAAFLARHGARVSYIHLKDIDPRVKARVIAERTDFYKACGQGIFCALGDGEADFPAIHAGLAAQGFDGWCTVEQDCDPAGGTSPVEGARANRAYLESIGFN